MQLTVTTNHKITFSVQAYWSEEGGMGTDRYGQDVDTLEAAVHLLELARADTSRQASPWVIVADVQTTTAKK